jgi:hypothetical protein
MVTVSIVGDNAHFEVEGMDKLWAFKSTIDIPLAHIRSVRVDPDAARGWWHGWRMPGTQVPGIILAGTYYHSEGAVFYDVHDTDNTVVVELHDEKYQRIVIEVESPAQTAMMLQAAIKSYQMKE